MDFRRYNGRCLICRSKNHFTADCSAICTDCKQRAARRCLLCGAYLCQPSSPLHKCNARPRNDDARKSSS